LFSADCKRAMAVGWFIRARGPGFRHCGPFAEPPA
jgi:hypothetical protein